MRHRRRITGFSLVAVLIALIVPASAAATLTVPVTLTVTGAEGGSRTMIRTKAYDGQCAASVGDPIVYAQNFTSRFKFGLTHDREHQCAYEESKLKYLFSVTPEDGLTFEAMAVQISQYEAGEPYAFRAQVIGCGRHVKCGAVADEHGHQIELTIGL